VPYV